MSPAFLTTVPPRPPFLTAAWRHLVIANFEVDPGLLTSRVPAGTELDLFEGRALVSIVGFRFLDARVLGVSIPGHRDFDEVNLRFYVRGRSSQGESLRAVTFVREFVPRRAIAAVARLCYNEPYLAVPMRHRVAFDPAVKSSLASVDYEWRLGGRWHSLGATVTGPPSFPTPGSEAEFTVEHYWGYTTQRNGTTRAYQVQHEPWRVWQAETHSMNLDPSLLYGAEWSSLVQAQPTAVIVAEGSTVAVFRGRAYSGRFSRLMATVT